MKIPYPKCIERPIYDINKKQIGSVHEYNISEYCGWAKTQYKELCIISDRGSYLLLGINYSNLPWVILSSIKSLTAAKQEAKIYINDHKSEYQKLMEKNR